MEKEMEVMDRLDVLKHIRRELHVIKEVVEQQESVISQMFDNLEHGEFEVLFHVSHKLRRVALEKLKTRKERMKDLDGKADSVFRDVS
jgi:hypothetical protein